MHQGKRKLYSGETQPGYGLAMAYGMPPLNWLKAFEASARHMSFAQAARDLNLTSTAVSHQVRSLRAASGSRVVRALGARPALTEMGAGLSADVRRAFEDLSATTTKLFRPEQR